MNEEFAFEQTDEGIGSLTFRCLSFELQHESDGFSDSDLAFFADMEEQA